MSLHLEQPITLGSFFQRQMRNRLWCTICVLDLQASFHQASEPLIDLEVEHYTLPRNINDADFDPSFQSIDISDKDELTDMTFSLVTHKAQLSGRLLNFVGTNISTRNSSPGHAASIWDDRLDQARLFEDQVHRLLATCDPESSAYAWFVFHGTKSLISSMRLSALRPLNRPGLRAPPRVQGSSDLLTAALSVLSKAQLIRTDPRGEGFRWYVRVQWHALAIAIAECFVCSDEQLLASVWPVVEAAYESTYTMNQEHHQQRQRGGEATTADYYRQDGSLRQPLQELMTRTRARVKNLLGGASGSVVPKAPVGGGGRCGWSSSGSRTPADSSTLQSPSVMSLAGIKEVAAHPLAQSTSLNFGFWPTPAFSPSSSSPDKGTGSSASLGQGLGEAWSLTPAYSSSMTDNRLPSVSVEDCMDLETMPDFSWQTWEELLSGIPPEGGLFDGSTGFY